MISRRELLGTLSALLLARAVKAGTRGLQRLDDASRALKSGSLTPVQWQEAAGAACAELDLAELCRRVSLDEIAARIAQPERGTSAEVVHLLPGQAFYPKVFFIGRGRAIIPHGHRNMVSQHLVLRGEVHGRHYQRLRDEPGALFLRPTIDKPFRPGDASSISDGRDNVHWFVAKSERAFTLDCIIDNLDPKRGYRYEIDFVDPDKASRESDGTLRMPRLQLEECLARYG